MLEDAESAVGTNWKTDLESIVYDLSHGTSNLPDIKSRLAALRASISEFDSSLPAARAEYDRVLRLAGLEDWKQYVRDDERLFKLLLSEEYLYLQCITEYIAQIEAGQSAEPQGMFKSKEGQLTTNEGEVK